METRETTKLVWPGSNDGYKKFVPPLNFETEEKEEKKTNGFEKKRRGERKKGKNREKWKKRGGFLFAVVATWEVQLPTMGVQLPLEFRIRTSSKSTVVLLNPERYRGNKRRPFGCNGGPKLKSCMLCSRFVLTLFSITMNKTVWFGIFWQRKCKFEQMKKNLFKNWKDKFELKIEKRRYEDIIFIN